MPITLIQPTIHLSHIMLLRLLSQTHKAQRLRVQIRIHPKNIQHNPRRRPIIPTPHNHPIANDQQRLALIIILELRQTINRPPQTPIPLRIARHLADHKLVMVVRSPLALPKFRLAKNLNPMMDTMMIDSTSRIYVANKHCALCRLSTLPIVYKFRRHTFCLSTSRPIATPWRALVQCLRPNGLESLHDFV
ncbi:hypothetical protein FA15DRAFT_412493 [Coprinopsis marcescibilis]|uniref:Uncharacterized protein n=1 Tax=Coprinopsis marcescibilis TaxID=230819 RepID=A0A5C3KAM8_COPMA|nr:hypothetical protein FA15DRAFT_412493 [Coprinopsis marcescibilis]